MASYTSVPRQDFYSTTLSTDIDGSTVTIPVSTAASFALTTGGVNTFYIVIDWDSSTKAEIVKCDGISGSNIIAQAGGRGQAKYNGGASTATSHAAGAKVIMSPLWNDFADIATAIATKANSGANSDITSLSALSTPLTVPQGGTGVATFTDGGVLIGAGAGAITNTGVLADGTIIIGDGVTAPTTLAAFSSSTGALKAANGGTGVASPTAKSVLIGQGASAMTGVAPGAASNVLASDGTNWTSATMPVGAAAKLLSNVNTTDGNNDSVARGSVVVGNSTPKWSALAVGAAGTALTSNGTDVSWGSLDPSYIAFPGSQSAIVSNNTDWGGSMFASNTRLLGRDATTATTLVYFLRPTSNSAFITNQVSNAGKSINLNMGCRILDGSTEYLLAVDDGAATFKRYTTDGVTEAAITFSGTAPTTARRIGFDVANGHVWVMDGGSKAATQIRRYTVSGTVLTNINSDITLGTAPSAAGSGNMLIGDTYMVLSDATSPPVFKRYGKTTGTLVDTWTAASFNASNAYRGFVISSTNKLYIMSAFGGSATSEGRLALFDLG